METSKKWYQRRLTKVILAVAVVGLAVGFVESSRAEQRVQGIRFVSDETVEDRFLRDEHLLDILTDRGAETVVGEKLIHIDLDALEKRMAEDIFVESCQVNVDLDGTLHVQVRECRPIVRIHQRGTAFYLGSRGQRLPLSEKHTARVPVLTDQASAKATYFRDPENWTVADSSFFDLLRQLDADPFLRAFTGQLDVEKDGSVLLFPLVGQQIYHLGEPGKWEGKLVRLREYLHRIVPQRGWAAHHRVSVAYEHQIVCQ